MAVAPIEMTIPGVTGFSLDLDLYPIGSDTAGVTNLNLTEASNRKGTYTTTTTAALSGLFLAIARVRGDTTVMGEGWVSMDDTTSLHIVGIDVPGKVLGGGAATILGIGAQVASSSGTGPYAVTVTVEDGDNDPVQGASVGFARSGEFLFGTTDVNGQVVFSCVAATWTLAVAATGFSHTPQTVVVSAAASVTASLVSSSSVPAAPSANLVTGYVYCYDSSEALASGVVIYGHKVDGNAGDGYSGSNSEFSFTSAVGGLASRSFLRGATYQVWRSVGVRYEFTAPASGASFALPEHLGSP